MRLPVLVFIVLLTACQGAIDLPPPPEALVVPDVVVKAGAPIERTRPMRLAEGSWSSPSALWLQGGAVTVLDGQVVKQRAGSGFSNVTVGTNEDPRTPGQLRAVTRRASGVVLAGTGGFFHDAPGRLLRAPLSDDFSMDTVRFVDGVGAALFVTTATDAVRVLDGRRELLRVTDEKEGGPLQVVVGRTESAALLVKGGSLYAVDLAARTVKPLARGLATVTAIDRRGDVVLLGTSEGLVEISPADVITRRTLTATTGAAQAVVDVEVVGDATLLSTATQVLELSPAGAVVVLADLERAWPDALTRDAAGDVWFLDGPWLARLTTSVAPTPPSFATDVRPFMTAHCTSCHATGASYAPVIDLATYATAKQWAPRTLERLKDTLSPMPPSSIETLTPTQYDVVVRWVEGGMLP
jgi:hypothetical protein